MATQQQIDQFRERKQVEWWNERYPDGTPVGYFFTSKDRAFKQAKTRGAAFISDAGKAVLFLEGRSSYVALANVRPITCAHHLRVALHDRIKKLIEDTLCEPLAEAGKIGLGVKVKYTFDMGREGCYCASELLMKQKGVRSRS